MIRSRADAGRRRHTTVALGVLLLGGLLVPPARTAAAENHPPVAVDDPAGDCAFHGSLPIPEDYLETGQYGSWFGLVGACAPLANDTDADGDPLTVEILEGPSHGDLLNDQWITAYRPDPDFSTPEGDWVSDSFTYRAYDGQAYSEPATVRLWIAPVNDPPTLTPGDDVTVAEDAGEVSLPWAMNVDPGPNETGQTVAFTLQPVSGEAHDCPAGPLMQDLPAIDGDGVLTFRVFPDCYGTEHVTFKVQDDGGTSPDYSYGSLTPNPDDTAADVSFDIVVTPDGVEAHEDTGINVPESAGPTPIEVLANDIAADGATLTVVSATNGAHGTVATTGGYPPVTYDPVQGYAGPDSFTYTVSDGSGGTDTATVNLTVVEDAGLPTVTGPLVSFADQAATNATTRARISWNGHDTETGISGFELQVSVDGGAFVTVPLPAPTVVAAYRNQVDGHRYRYRVRAIDGAFNVGAWATGPTVTASRVQESSASVHYTGAWVTVADPNALGGRHRFASSLSAKARLTVTGRDVALVATKTPTSGRVRVWIDGVLVRGVDLRSASTQYRLAVFRYHFATPGTHTIELRPAGGGRVYLDAFLVMR